MGKKVIKSGIQKKGKFLIVPEDTPLEAMTEFADIPEQLIKVLQNDISWQQRQEITVSKSLSSPTLDARWLASLLALFVTVSLNNDETMLLSEYLSHKPSSAKMTAIQIPVSEDIIVSESKVGMTPADKPIVAAICSIKTKKDTIENGNIVLIGVWQKEKAKLSKASSMINDQLSENGSISQIVRKVINEVSPKGDYRGSEEYRRSMAGVVTRRALEKCLLGVHQK